MQDTERKLYNIILDIIGNKEIELTGDVYLIDDLGFDSIQLINLIVEIEEEFDISFDDSDLLFDNYNHLSDLCNLINKLLEQKAD